MMRLMWETLQAKRIISLQRVPKHFDTVMNTTKSSTSIMFCGAADGTLPTFVVYEALNMYKSWTSNGPKGEPCCKEECCRGGAQYRCTKSGWFDQPAFTEWFKYSILPHTGTKVLTGHNLRFHFSFEVLKL